jgi:hypothetical protein
MGGKHDVDTINQVVNTEVAASQPIVDQTKINQLLNIDEDIPYVKLEGGFIANPFSLLGRVVEVRKLNGKIPDSVSATNVEFALFPVPGVKTETDSQIKSPILRQSIVINDKITANVGLFNYLKADIDAESVFSINVIDQAGGLIDVQDPSWATGVKQWKTDNADVLNDDEICYLYIIIGFVQKQIIRKKFKKFDGNAKGGAMGFNVEGSVYLSTDEFSMDIRYGLTPAILKRPKPAIATTSKSIHGLGVSSEEKALFSKIQNLTFVR